jgi:hypothetical protein
MSKGKSGKGLGDLAQTLVDDAKTEAKAKVLKAQAAEQEARLETKNLRKDVEELLAQFNDLKAASYPPPVKHPRNTRTSKKGDFVRVIIPDLHGSALDRPACEAALREIKRIDPDEVVIMGDILECDGFLAQHLVMGYVAQTTYSFQDDVAAANWFLDELAKAAPKARVRLIEGNHDDRIEKWIVNQVQKHHRDAQFLYDLLGPAAVLNLAERGIEFHRRCEGLPEFSDIPGVIKLGKIFFTHELGSSKNAASQALAMMGGNVNYAHTHREDTASMVLPAVGLIKAWCAGCLCKRQRMWNHSRPDNWSHGIGVEYVAKSEEFLHIQIPIWGGKSLLGSFLDYNK